MTLQILPALAATAPAPATVGQAYTGGPAATGGVAPYTWTAASLPTGLTLNPSTGALTGTPAVDTHGDYPLTVADSQSPARTATVTLQVLPATLAIGTSSLPAANQAQVYSAALLATGGVAPYTWMATGLPTGLSLVNGEITGTPTQSGTFAVVVSLSDGATPAQTASVTLVLSVTAADVKPVPTLGGWAISLLGALAAALRARRLRRRRR
ncbi:putative Ig domain-containing protein [Comamonas serinivorans]|uniref:putative Ig domain-containing protein n=1 Tax=Comamonas serinivorans TaxID=1082851 RepID=UPI00146D3C8B|nr:putative Ig domain-containing protein [Comamonas serinivorans]